MDYVTEIKLDAMLDVLSGSATEEQQENLVAWIVDNVGKVYWSGIADELVMHGLENAYTDLTMRCGECGF